MTDDKMLARIAALLRQAEGTDNAHEAEAFMAAAQRLATATSIDLAVARAHSATRTAAQAPTQRTITIGEPGSRGLRTYVQLFAGIAAANDVRCDVASNSTFVYAYGFAEDIDASHALYASLVVQMVRSCDAYLATGAHQPTPTITARLNFQLAFGARIGQRLSEAREEARREATKEQATAAGDRTCVAQQGSRTARPLPAQSKARGTWRADQRVGGLLLGRPARRGPGRAAGPAGRQPRASRGADPAVAVSPV